MTSCLENRTFIADPAEPAKCATYGQEKPTERQLVPHIFHDGISRFHFHEFR
jgi:hypothetical protein